MGRRSAARGTFVATVLAASAAAPAPEAAARPKGRCGSGDEPVAVVVVDWGPAQTSSGCFYFSGPHGLGRDDQLGPRAGYVRAGNLVSLSFDGRLFEGKLEGDRVELARRSQHDFGSVWTATETISGRVGGSDACVLFTGTYRYEECNGGGSDSCPGPCTIAAPLTVSFAH